MHGEDSLLVKDGVQMEETPPYARGRPTYEGVKGKGGGNTPVCTGKTCGYDIYDPVVKKHPRMHGED